MIEDSAVKAKPAPLNQKKLAELFWDVEECRRLNKAAHGHSNYVTLLELITARLCDLLGLGDRE